MVLSHKLTDCSIVTQERSREKRREHPCSIPGWSLEVAHVNRRERRTQSHRHVGRKSDEHSGSGRPRSGRDKRRGNRPDGHLRRQQRQLVHGCKAHIMFSVGKNYY